MKYDPLRQQQLDLLWHLFNDQPFVFTNATLDYAGYAATARVFDKAGKLILTTVEIESEAGDYLDFTRSPFRLEWFISIGTRNLLKIRGEYRYVISFTKDGKTPRSFVGRIEVDE